MEFAEAAERILAAEPGLGAPTLAQALEAVGVRVGVARLRRWLRGRGEIGTVVERPNLALAGRLRRFDGPRKKNILHSIDLLSLPTDKIRDKKYKLAMVIKDAGTRYVDAEALTSKTTTSTKAALQRIYRRGPLRFPQRVRVDGGTEFRGVFKRLLESKNTRVEVAESGNHRRQALVESANRTIAKRLFAAQHVAERDAGGVNREWVRRLPVVVERMNNTRNNATGITPVAAMEVPDDEMIPLKKLGRKLRQWIARDDARPPLKVGTRVRYPLDRPADGGNWRATDIRMSDPVAVENIRVLPSRPVEYRAGGRWWTRAHLIEV